MNRTERAYILEGLLEDLPGVKTFELFPEEIEALTYLLESWDKRRKYLRTQYAGDRQNRIEDSKRRYRERKGRINNG